MASLEVNPEEVAVLQMCMEVRFRLRAPGRVTQAQTLMAGKLLRKLEDLGPKQMLLPVTIQLWEPASVPQPQTEPEEVEQAGNDLELAATTPEADGLVETHGFAVDDEVIITTPGDFEGLWCRILKIWDENTIQVKDIDGFLLGQTFSWQEIQAAAFVKQEG